MVGFDGDLTSSSVLFAFKSAISFDSDVGPKPMPHCVNTNTFAMNEMSVRYGLAQSECGGQLIYLTIILRSPIGQNH